MINSSFSRQLPTLQLAIDSTSLGAFKTCPRYYYYRIVCGWAPMAESVHLKFGILLHAGVEAYHKWRAHGQDHDDSLRKALLQAMHATWQPELRRPWTSDNPTKNRLTLLRTLVWYLDQHRDDPLQTLTLASGAPAVELRFAFDSGYQSLVTGEPFQFCGYLGDRLAALGEDKYVVDIKTTSRQLSPHWFAQFNPHNQFSLYTFAGKIAYGEPLRGLIVDGCQVLAGETRFQRAFVARDASQIDEWYDMQGKWLAQIDACAEEGQSAGPSAWPMNETSCDKFGGCEFREVCARSPAARPQWLASAYRQRIWDPLRERGDI